MSTKRTATVAKLLSWSLPGHIRAAERGDPDAKKALFGTLESLLKMGEVPEELMRMLRQLKAGADAAEATHTKNPANSSHRGYRDARIIAEVKGGIMLRDWAKADDAELKAQGHDVPTVPMTMVAIYADVAKRIGMKADRVEDIWKKRKK